MARAKIFPFLWYATEAEEAARLYAAIFPDSRVDQDRRAVEGPAVHDPVPGRVDVAERPDRVLDRRRVGRAARRRQVRRRHHGISGVKDAQLQAA